jgi:hypothetical protein
MNIFSFSGAKLHYPFAKLLGNALHKKKGKWFVCVRHKKAAY